MAPCVALETGTLRDVRRKRIVLSNSLYLWCIVVCLQHDLDARVRAAYVGMQSISLFIDLEDFDTTLPDSNLVSRPGLIAKQPSTSWVHIEDAT